MEEEKNEENEEGRGHRKRTSSISSEISEGGGKNDKRKSTSALNPSAASSIEKAIDESFKKAVEDKEEKEIKVQLEATYSSIISTGEGKSEDDFLPTRLTEYYILVGINEGSQKDERGFYQPSYLDRYPKSEYDDFPLPGVEIFCFPNGLSTFERWKLKDFEYIPAFILACVTFIEKEHNIIVPGLYRGHIDDAAVDNFIKGATFDMLESTVSIHPTEDVQLVAQALKVYCATYCNPPLIPTSLYDTMISLDNMSVSKRISTLSTCLSTTFNYEERLCLGFIIHHIGRVADRSSTNLMTVDNLAVVFAPGILRPNNDPNDPSNVLSLPVRASVIEFMVDHRISLFPESINVLENSNCFQMKDVPLPVPEPRLHNFVLSVASEKTYGSCLTYYDPYHEAELPSLTASIIADERGARVWAPKVMCLISRYPFTDTFLGVLKDIYLSAARYLSLATTTNDNEEDDENKKTYNRPAIERIIQLITEEIPAPIPGFLGIDFNINHSKYRCAIPRVGDFPTSSSSLSLMFEIFDLRTWLKIFNAFILEQRILLYSEHLYLLSSVSEALVAAMYPFKWQRIYIPILPIQLMDVLEAPMPFLVGMSTQSYLSLDPSLLDDIVIVDIDQGKVSNNEKIEQIPPYEINTLFHNLRQVLYPAVSNMDNHDAVQENEDIDIEGIKNNNSILDRHNINSLKERGLRHAFLLFFVHLLKGYHLSLFFLNEKMPIFNSEEHLKKHAAKGSKNFLKPFFETMSFSQFLSNYNDKVNAMFHSFYTAILTNSSTKLNAENPSSYYFIIPPEVVLITPSQFQYESLIMIANKGKTYLTVYDSDAEKKEFEIKRIKLLQRCFPITIPKTRSEQFQKKRRWIRDGVASFLKIPLHQLQQLEWVADMNENQKFLSTSPALEARENDIETILQSSMSSIYLGFGVAESEVNKCIDSFKLAYGRELFVMILKQPQHGGSGGVSSQKLGPAGFECLARMCNALLKLCDIEEDYKTARGIMHTASHFYRESTSISGNRIQVFLTKRIIESKIWQQPVFWEYAFIESLEDKLREKQPSKNVVINNNNILHNTMNTTANKSEKKEAVFELASEYVLQMLNIGVANSKVKTFVLRISQTQKIAHTHTSTLEMLVENLTKMKELNDEGDDNIEYVEEFAEEEEIPMDEEDSGETKKFNLIEIVKNKATSTRELIQPKITFLSKTNNAINDNSSSSNLEKKRLSEINLESLLQNTTIGEHDGPVLCMARGDHQLVTGGGDEKAFIYDLNTNEATHCLTGHTDAISCLLFDEDIDTVVTGSHDRSVRLWKLKRDKQFWGKRGSLMGSKSVIMHGHTGSVLCISRIKSSSIENFITGSFDHSLRLWDINKTKSLNTFIGHAQPVTCVKVAHHSPLAISGSRDNTLRLWNVEDGKCLNVFTGHIGTVNEVHIDKERLVSCSNDGTVKVWDERSALCVSTLSAGGGKVKCMQVGGLKDPTVVCGMDNNIYIWDLRQFEKGPMLTLKGHEKLVTSLKWDWTKVVSGSKDSTVKIWNSHTGDCLHSSKMYSDSVSCIDFDDSRIYSASWDGRIKVTSNKHNEEKLST